MSISHTDESTKRTPNGVTVIENLDLRFSDRFSVIGYYTNGINTVDFIFHYALIKV